MDEPTFKSKLEIRRKAKGNGGRQRENLESCPVELCKNAEGQWTKEVPERLSPEEVTAFERLNQLCLTDPITDWLSTNHKLRYLRGWHYNPEGAFAALIAGEEQRAHYDSDSITYEAISTCINWGVYALLGSDRDGRPVIYAKLRNIDIAQTDLRSCAQFMIYVLD
jgi:hypothetical protein